ncbi:MAG: hypothetical protein Q8N68_02230 [bacterium]|nr:hypothetical protein [bacterium]
MKIIFYAALAAVINRPQEAVEVLLTIAFTIAEKQFFFNPKTP